MQSTIRRVLLLSQNRPRIMYAVVGTEFRCEPWILSSPGALLGLSPETASSTSASEMGILSS